MPLIEQSLENFYGIVIKKNSFGEGHATFTLLEKNKGKIEIFAFGSDREKSKKRTILLFSNIVEGVLYRSKNMDYYSVKEVSLIKEFLSINNNLNKIAYLYLIFEITNIFLEYSYPALNFFNLTTRILEKLDQKTEVEKYAFYLIFNLFKIEGILPDFSNEKSINSYLKELQGKNFSLGNGTKRFITDVLNEENCEFLDRKRISPSVITNTLELISLIVKHEKNVELSSPAIIPLNLN